MTDKLEVPVGCARCRDRPYTWRSGLRHHIARKHASLPVSEQLDLLEKSLKNLRGWRGA